MKKFFTISILLSLIGLSIRVSAQFTDNFSGTLSAWTDMNGSDWDIQNDELHGFYSLTMGSIYNSQADLILKDQYQITGNWKASIDFIRVADDQFFDYYAAWATFSLWSNENNKIAIGIGGAGDFWGGNQDSISFGAQEWNGTWGPSAPVSINQVSFTWDPDEWHTASIEKRDNIYSLFIDDACIGHYIDNFLNGQGKIGLHTYGTKRYDNFTLNTCSNLPTSVYDNQNYENPNVIKIYPIPASNQINIASSTTNNNGEYFIYDIFGRLIETVKMSGENITQIDIMHLNSGLYMIKSIEDGNLNTGKFIKQ
jgi:hypothetical protein